MNRKLNISSEAFLRNIQNSPTHQDLAQQLGKEIAQKPIYLSALQRHQLAVQMFVGAGEPHFHFSFSFKQELVQVPPT